MGTKITIDYIQEEVNKIAPGTILLSTEYKNNREPLEFLCSCGERFYKNWSTIQNKKTCVCRSCARKHGWKTLRREENFEEEIKHLFEDHGFTVLEPIYSKKDKILCKDQNGMIGRISVDNVRLGKHFGIFSLKYNKENLLHNLNRFLKNNGVKTVVDSFKEDGRTCETILFCICECGEHFTARLGNLTTQGQLRCATCSQKKSYLELKTEQELRKYTENFYSQYRFKDCINPKTNYPLIFDFYLPEQNAVIETDGKQHEEPVSFGHQSQEQIEEELKYRKKLDKIKDLYCQNNGIKMVRISYRNFDKEERYKEIIKSLFHCA